MIQSFQVLHQLHRIYPDIEGELCSRHSSTLSRVKDSFQELYSSEPSHCAIANGIAHLTQTPHLHISMALQNGVIAYFRGEATMDRIFINSNRDEGQLILDLKGNILEGDEVLWASEMAAVYQLATEDLSLSKVHGGIFYLHSNLPNDCFSEKESWMSAFFFALLHINAMLSEYSAIEISNKMAGSKLFGPSSEVQDRLLNHSIRKLHITIDGSTFNLDVPADIKLICYRLKDQQGNPGLEPKEAATQDSSRIKKISNLIASCSSFLLFNELLQQLQAVNESSMSPPQDSQEIIAKFKLESYLIVEGGQKGSRFLIISSNRAQYTDLINRLKKHWESINSTPREEFYQSRWKKEGCSPNVVFGAVPSQGIAVLDPSEEMWFND